MQGMSKQDRQLEDPTPYEIIVLYKTRRKSAGCLLYDNILHSGKSRRGRRQDHVHTQSLNLSRTQT
jgi:hypothetical protein